MGHRTWFKIFSDGWLRGKLRSENASTRGIAVDILALANDLSYGDQGEIKLADNIGLSDEQLYGIFHINMETWRGNKDRLADIGFIQVDENNVIKVVNWKRYQSEYRRQKAYRGKREGEEGEVGEVSEVSEETPPPPLDKGKRETPLVEPETKEEAGAGQQSPEKKPSDPQVIFDYWNSKDIVVHRELEPFKATINARLKNYTVEELKQAIDNYAMVLSKPKEYWFTYRWSLKHFLRGNLDNFLNIDKVEQSYRSVASGKGAKAHKGSSRQLPGRQAYKDPKSFRKQSEGK